MIDEDDEALSAEIMFSTEEILAEFQQRCEEAAMNPGVTVPELSHVAEALYRMLDRASRQR